MQQFCGLWAPGSASQLFFRSSLHGQKMTVAGPGILTQSFSKSGYGAARVSRDNSSCMLSASTRERKSFHRVPLADFPV